MQPRSECATTHELIAALPVREIVSATHIIADLTLGLGKVFTTIFKD
jgi:acetoacetate decarboxylase